ncbi:MAG: hypothetical protein JNM40_03230 [Myxococcales bacterium]|nr:hypothetical protein [Myxococcales bacterium]
MLAEYTQTAPMKRLLAAAKTWDSKRMDFTEHEALCRRCGMSCHFAIPVNGLAVVIDALRCKFLAQAEGEPGRYHCTVYASRHSVAPWCHSAESALAAGFLAQDCPYARGHKGYRGKVRLSHSLLRQVLPAIITEILRVGIPIGADPDRVRRFLFDAGTDCTYTVSADGSRYLFASPVSPTAQAVSDSQGDSQSDSQGDASADSYVTPVRATARRSSSLNVLPSSD